MLFFFELDFYTDFDYFFEGDVLKGFVAKELSVHGSHAGLPLCFESTLSYFVLTDFTRF